MDVVTGNQAKYKHLYKQPNMVNITNLHIKKQYCLMSPKAMSLCMMIQYTMWYCASANTGDSPLPGKHVIDEPKGKIWPAAFLQALLGIGA